MTLHGQFNTQINKKAYRERCNFTALSSSRKRGRQRLSVDRETYHATRHGFLLQAKAICARVWGVAAPLSEGSIQPQGTTDVQKHGKRAAQDCRKQNVARAQDQ